MIYHILVSYEWEQAKDCGFYQPISLDWEGFIHFSTLEQVIGTANRFYRGQTDLLLLEVDETKLSGELRYEASADSVSDLFPHYYGELPVAAALHAWAFPPNKDGRFSLPRALIALRVPEIITLLIDSALEAVSPVPMIRNSFCLNGDTLTIDDISFNLSDYKKIRLLALGKAAQGMAAGVFECLEERVNNGLVITKHRDDAVHLPDQVEVALGDHPLPGERSLECGKKALEFISSAGEKELILFLISGGGSSLMTLPEEGISFADYRAASRLLLESGATIHEFNTIRKHIDQVKGGKLAKKAFPANIVTCILSDVIGNDPDVIASGPTVADPTTFSQCLEIIDKYHLADTMPSSIITFLKNGAERETSAGKSGDENAQANLVILLGDNRKAAEASLRKAEALGFAASIVTNSLAGEAAIVGKQLAGNLTQPVAYIPEIIIYGGETTVSIHGNSGLGGRNLETALAAVKPLADKKNAALITFATDGEDGPTDAAGAIVTAETAKNAAEQGLDPATYLQKHDSYHFFEKIDGLIKTGPSGTNVNDLLFILKY